MVRSDELIFLFLEYNSNAARTLDRAREHLQAFSQLSIESGCLSFKTLNLITFNSIVGCNVYLDSIDEIQGKKVISKGILVNSMKELSLKIQEKNKARAKFTAELPRRPKFSSGFIQKLNRSTSQNLITTTLNAYTRLLKNNEMDNESEFDLSDFAVKVTVRHKNTEVNLKRLKLKNLDTFNSNNKIPLDQSLY